MERGVRTGQASLLWPLGEAALQGWGCLSSTYKPPLKSSSALPWTPWGAEQPPALLLPTVQEAGTLKYEHLAFYYPI